MAIYRPSYTDPKTGISVTLLTTYTHQPYSLAIKQIASLEP